MKYLITFLMCLISTIAFSSDLYTLGPSNPAPGQDLAVQKLYLNHDFDVLGIQYVATYDYPEIDVIDIGYGADVPLIGPNMEPPDFFIIVIDPLRPPPDVPTIIVSLIWETTPPFYGDVLPAGENHHMLDIKYSVSDTVSIGDEYNISFRNGLSTHIGSPPISNIYTYPPGFSLLLPWIKTPIVISEGFIRGDADGSGTFNGLVDGIYMLQWGFSGGPPPVCEDAGDADDNGFLHPLVDGLYIFNYQFINGPPPPQPFNIPGGDPTEDILSCQ